MNERLEPSGMAQHTFWITDEICVAEQLVGAILPPWTIISAGGNRAWSSHTPPMTRTPGPLLTLDPLRVKGETTEEMQRRVHDLEHGRVDRP